MACRCPRARALLLIAVLALLAAAAPAKASLGGSTCGSDGSLRCGTLAVPLDDSGAVPGSVGLAFAVRPAGAVPTDEAVVPLAGGPGQAALPFVDDFAASLKALTTNRDLLVYDQRGTGSSGALGCFGDAGPSSSAQVRACSTALGASRSFYRSIDSARDIEALRVAGGYRRLVLYAVSYGTRVALTYAALHPDRVAALVLDSVVPITGPDVWSRPSFAALGRILRELCADGACRLATRDPNRDLRVLARRLARAPLSGTVTGPNGSRVRVRLTELGLWQTLLAGDLNPTLRAELPGAVSAALRRDVTPVLRLRARAAGLNGNVPVQQHGAFASGDVNATLFTATRCSETELPWDPAAVPATRRLQAEAALGQVDASAFAPFDRSVPRSQSLIDLCAGWLDAPLPAVALGAPPAVPTLVLDGAADLRTPVEQARSVTAGIAGARFVSVPNTGHSVLGSDLSGCVDAEIAAFAAGGASTCTPKATPISPTPRPPLHLSSMAGGTRALRTVNAVRATLNDVRRQLIGDAIAAGRAVTPGARTGGLRGGVATVTADAIVTLRRVSYVPGVRVSGSYAIARGATSELVVTGPSAARGRLQIDGRGVARGVLGGRPVEAAAASAAARGGDGWGDGLSLPRFARPGLRALR